MIVDMPTPAIIFWGPNQTQIYNDGYAVIMGRRHPRYFAAGYADCWPDTYPVVYPWMRHVLESGGTWQVENQHFTLTRHGFSEECYFTFTFSPLRDDDGEVAGIIQPVIEMTESVIGERRALTLSRLAAQVDSLSPVTREAMAALGENTADVPMSLVYLREPTGALRLTAQTGLDSFKLEDMASAPISRAAGQAFEANAPVEIPDVEAALGGRRHVGPWPEPTRRGYAVPLRRSPADPPRGTVIFGLSPRLHFGDRYRDFLGAAARELAANLAAEEAKRTERALLAREREARREAELQKRQLTDLMMQAPTPMVVLRGDQFVIELANEHACRLWMRDPGDVIGKPILDALPELRDQVFEELLSEVFRTGEAYVGKEIRARLKTPERGFADSYLNFVYAPLWTPAGEVDGILIVAFDVTEQVHARRQVNELRDAAESASRAKDEFFALLGHELRNPLAPIFTALQLMRLRGGSAVERERLVIERQANHLVRLVDDLLDVSGITRGKISLRKERGEIAGVVTHAVETALPMIEERRHELVVDVPDSGLEVHADPDRLSQAISNLLTNAAKYTEPGGRITITAARRGHDLELSVRDTGIGIDPAILPRVFDVFVQERQTLDRARGGLGLGLAIVHGIVELHGGSVEAKSEARGAGSEFVVRLPLAPSRDADGRDIARPAAPSALPKRRAVLVVDDNEDAATTLAASLEDAGHEVRIAYDGPGALRVAESKQVDVALLDIGLPVMNGYELIRRLRELPHLQSMPAVAVTGYGQASDRMRSQAAGFDAHLVKPVDLLEVESLVRELPAAGHPAEELQTDRRSSQGPASS